MLGSSIQLNCWNNTPEIREVLARSVGFGLPFESNRIFLMPWIPMKYRWFWGNLTRLTQMVQCWISCEYYEATKVSLTVVMNQNRETTVLGFWAINIVTQQKTEHLSSATVDTNWPMPWRPSLLLVHGLRSPGTNPGHSMEATRFISPVGDRKGPIPIASAKPSLLTSNLWRDELPNFGSTRTPKDIKLIKDNVYPPQKTWL